MKRQKKAPKITARWGPVTVYNAAGEVVRVEPAKREPKQKRRRGVQSNVRRAR
jgi:hypothetical protein